MFGFKIPKINLSLILLTIFIVAFFCGDFIPVAYKSFFFSISLTIKEVLLLFLPFIIFSCLFHSLVANQGKALRFVIIVLFAVVLSNFLSISTSFGFSLLTLPSLGALSLNESMSSAETLVPLWRFSFPGFLPNEIALLAGLVLGLLFSMLPYQFPIRMGEKANRAVSFFLQKLVVPALPLFALGYVLKLQHEGILARVVDGYGPVILLIVAANVMYLLLMFSIAAKFKFAVCWQYIKNVVPVGILGFSTMSSMATMPATLDAAEKNTGNPELVRAIIPATVNIHMIGDSIALPIMLMATLLTFGQELPNFQQYLLFLQFFMLVKFAVPGIPGGTTLVLLPGLEQYLGFTPEMSAFIAALYIMFDPIITSGNVVGNSALSIILTRVMQFFPKKAKVPISEYSVVIDK